MEKKKNIIDQQLEQSEYLKKPKEQDLRHFQVQQEKDTQNIWSRTAQHMKEYSSTYFSIFIVILVITMIRHIESKYRNDQVDEKISEYWEKLSLFSIEKNSNFENQNKFKSLGLSSNKNNYFSYSDIFEKKTYNLQSNNDKDVKNENNNGLIKPDQLVHLKYSYLNKASNNQQAKTSPTKMPGNNRAIAGVGMETRKLAAALISLKNQQFDKVTPLSMDQQAYYQKKYNLSNYTTQLPFCIVVPSYNNVKGDRHKKNMKSILMQNYTNYHIVFIDDASTDGTGDQIEAMLISQTKVPPQRYLFIKNKQQKRAMPNLRRAANQLCQPEEIYLIVDGDDELIGRKVLSLFNSVFQSKGVWFMYTNFLNIRGSVGYSRPFPAGTIKGNKYRTYPFVTSHLRAFYTQLFRNIRQQDLKDNNGNYLKAANDVAICIPILEQSHERVIYLPELTYYYNSNTGQNNHQIRLKQQKSNDKMLRKRKSYKPLESLFQGTQIKAATDSPLNQSVTNIVSEPLQKQAQNAQQIQNQYILKYNKNRVQ